MSRRKDWEDLTPTNYPAVGSHVAVITYDGRTYGGIVTRVNGHALTVNGNSDFRFEQNLKWFGLPPMPAFDLVIRQQAEMKLDGGVPVAQTAGLHILDRERPPGLEPNQQVERCCAMFDCNISAVSDSIYCVHHSPRADRDFNNHDAS